MLFSQENDKIFPGWLQTCINYTLDLKKGDTSNLFCLIWRWIADNPIYLCLRNRRKAESFFFIQTKNDINCLHHVSETRMRQKGLHFLNYDFQIPTCFFLPKQQMVDLKATDVYNLFIFPINCLTLNVNETCSLIFCIVKLNWLSNGRTEWFLRQATFKRTLDSQKIKIHV